MAYDSWVLETFAAGTSTVWYVWTRYRYGTCGVVSVNVETVPYYTNQGSIYVTREEPTAATS